MAQIAQAQNPTFVTKFKNLAEEVANLLKNTGLSTKPYHSPDLPHYSGLTKDKQRRALESLAVYKQTLISCVQSDEDIRSGSRSLWHALRVMRLKGTNSLFNQIEADDAIELYSADGIQLWRNYRVMEVCSYTLEEIYSFDWLQRYERDQEMAQQVLQHVLQALNDPKNPVVVDVPAHIIRETFSSDRIALRVKHKTLHPVSNVENGEVAGFVAVSGAEQVDWIQASTPKPSLAIVSPS